MSSDEADRWKDPHSFSGPYKEQDEPFVGSTSRRTMNGYLDCNPDKPKGGATPFPG